MFNVLDFGRQVRQTVAVKRKLAGFERSIADWPRLQLNRPYRTSMVVWSMTDYPYQIKLELLLARLAEEGGCKMYLAGKPEAHVYWKRMGFPSERFLPAMELMETSHEPAERKAEDLLSACHSFEDVKALVLEGVEVGKFALSALGRRLFQGLFDVNDPAIHARLQGVLASTIQHQLVCKEILAKYGVDQFLINEPNYEIAGLSYTALGRGHCYVQFAHGYREDTLVLKRYHADLAKRNPFSIGDSTWSKLSSMEITPAIDAAIREIFDRKYSSESWLSRRIMLDAPRESPDEVRNRLHLDSKKPTAVIFSNVLWDANMFWGRDIYPNGSVEWLVETVRQAIHNPSVNWIVKVHPANVWKMQHANVSVVYNDVEALKKEFGTLPSHVRIVFPEENVNPFSLFAVTDVGVTIRGTVALELPALGVPVITGGSGRCSGFGFTYDPATREEYERLLQDVQNIRPLGPEQLRLAKLYFWGTFVGHLWKTGLVRHHNQQIEMAAHDALFQPWRNYGEPDRLMSEFLSKPEEEDYFFPGATVE
jgi:hypothetical protein